MRTILSAAASVLAAAALGPSVDILNNVELHHDGPTRRKGGQHSWQHSGGARKKRQIKHMKWSGRK